MVLMGVIAAGVASWAVTPWIGMARHGTVDQRIVAAWRVEPARRPVTFTEVDVPAPRATVDAPHLTA